MLSELIDKLEQAMRRRRFRDHIASIGLDDLHHLTGIVGQTGSTIHFPDRCLTQQQIDLEELVELGCKIVKLADEELVTVNMLLEREMETIRPTIK